MRTQRTINLAWPLVVLAAVLLAGGAVWGLGAQLFENPTTQKSYPNKTVAGYLGAQSGGRVEVQTMSMPTEGQVLVAGCGTSAETSTSVATCARFGASASGLPPGGTPGQVAGVTVFSTGTVTATGWTAANGTIFAGSNVALSTGTNTTTGTSANLSDGPRIHAVGFEPTLPSGGPGEVLCYVGTGTSTTTSKAACAQSTGAAYAFSTSTPSAVATSGAIGTSTLLVRSDHVHQGDGDSKVAAYSGQTPNYLENVTSSSDSSITLAENSGKLDFRANFGTAASTVCVGNDSRLSNARAPTAHASTHVEGGIDAIAVATQSVDGLMSHEDKVKLDSTSSTPTASYIPVADASGTLNAWVTLAYHRACATTDQDSSSTPQFATMTFTPRTGTNYLRFSFTVSGYAAAVGGSTPEALAFASVSYLKSGTWYIAGNNRALQSIPYGKAATLSAGPDILWDSQFASSTQYQLDVSPVSGRFISPVASQSPYYTACFLIEELKV